MMKRIVLAMATLALAGCGKIAPLEPPPGKPLPVRPLMATSTPNAEQLLTYTPQARPERIDELVHKSVPRKVDRFDLPPPDGGAAPTLEGEPPTPSEQAGPATPQ
jgi:predicted small lipoprotein YifL